MRRLSPSRQAPKPGRLHRDDAQMLDRVRRLPFAEKPLANVASSGKLGMKQFHCDAATVPMDPCVDSGHAADPEHVLDAVLATADGLTDARLDHRSELVVDLRHTAIRPR